MVRGRCPPPPPRAWYPRSPFLQKEASLAVENTRCSGQCVRPYGDFTCMVADTCFLFAKIPFESVFFAGGRGVCGVFWFFGGLGPKFTKIVTHKTEVSTHHSFFLLQMTYGAQL